MINAADNRRSGRRLSPLDVLAVLYLCGMTFLVWDNADLAGSALGVVAGLVVASWPVLLAVASGARIRPTWRRIRREEQLLRAARKVAEVATPAPSRRARRSR